MNISDLSGLELVSLASSLSTFIAINTNEEELAILASFFAALGDNLAIYATSPLKSYLKDKNN